MFKVARGWKRTTDGLTKQVSDTHLVIEPYGSKWRLINRLDIGELQNQPAASHIKRTDKKIWQADTVDECLRISRAYEDYLEKKGEFFSTRLFSKRVLTASSGNGKRALEGIELVARRTRDGDITVKAWHPNDDRQEIGYLSTEYTGFHPTLALGEVTTNSASYIERQWRGKGLCAEMYAFQQEVLGIPPVPHGRNLVEGDQTTDAKVFWEKRSRHHKVPGLNDLEVLARVNRIAPIVDLFNMESSKLIRYNPQLMVVLGYHLNSQTICFRETDGEEGIDRGDIILSACVIEVDQLFAGLGRTSKQALLAELEENLHGYKTEVIPSHELLTEITSYIQDSLDWSEFENSVLLQEPIAERILIANGFELKPGFKDYLEQVTKKGVEITP